ncbi:hypothetical protein TNCV_4772361 [Trichonephila clavipes]|nr:hypothetical protein TNCV_4772361 [Trichonephila clavipes]
MMLQKQFIIIGCLELDGQPKMLLEYYAVISGFFFRPISTAPETTEKIIICAWILHNIMREAKVLAPGQTHIDSTLPLPVENFLPLTEYNVRSTTNHTQIREMFKNYFNGPGAVEWQKNYAKQH